jgi:hypothetical protein
VSSLVADPAWAAQVRDEGLLVHAGADSVFLLADLAAAVADELAGLFGGADPAAVDVDALSMDARLLLPQLRGIGALRLSGVAPPELAVGLQFVPGAPAGVTDGGVAGELARQLGAELAPVPAAGVVVVVRTGGQLSDLLPVAHEHAAARRPHLLCDLTGRHTVVLGPLVVPGLTACLSCLVGRLAVRWGDQPAPPRPAAAGEPVLVAALLARVLRTMRGGRYELAERTVALDLDDLSTTVEAVLPASECPVCPQVDPVGIALPW